MGNEIRGRYAPSPTGGLHAGNARTALLAWLQIRALGGRFVMRIEDLDRARIVPDATRRLLEDLRWLGLDWDEGPDVGGDHGPYLQSARDATYAGVLARLKEQGAVFECFCSRAEVAAASSAPHGHVDDGPRYPGTCRTLAPERREAKRNAGRLPALRFRVEAGEQVFEDGIHGRIAVDVSAEVGDFVVRRMDGIAAYQLAVAVDDAGMGITHVLRGEDLLTSAPRQIRLLERLGLPVPRYFHVPLMMGPDGQRLSKRHGDVTLQALRHRGVRPERLVAALARSSGLTDAEEIDARSLIAGFEPGRIGRGPARFDPAAL